LFGPGVGPGLASGACEVGDDDGVVASGVTRLLTFRRL